jgi:mono/diheme cytochrome c family protein
MRLHAAILFLLVTPTTTATTAMSIAEPIDADVALVEVEAYVRARSAFDRNCFRCHTASGDEATKKGMEKLDMGRYPFGGKRAPTASLAVRKALGASGAKPTMPKDDPGSLTSADLAMILRWADTFDAARGIRDRQSGSGGASGNRRESASP